MLEPDPIITCVDCGGRAHLLSSPRRDEEDTDAAPWQEGDIVAYRCEDCLDRWDIVLLDFDLTRSLAALALSVRSSYEERPFGPRRRTIPDRTGGAGSGQTEGGIGERPLRASRQ